MNYDPIWQSFVATGDPVYYMLYKAVSEERKQNPKRRETKEAAGDAPRPQD